MASGEEEEALKGVKGINGAGKGEGKPQNAIPKEAKGVEVNTKGDAERHTKNNTKTPKQPTKEVRWEEEEGSDSGSDFGDSRMSIDQDGGVDEVDEEGNKHKYPKRTIKPRYVYKIAPEDRKEVPNVRDGEWFDHEFSDDSEGCGELEEGQVSQEVLKYRGFVSAYLRNTGIYDVSSHGALERIMSATGYEFSEEEKEELLVMINSMIRLNLDKLADSEDEQTQIGDVSVLWYSSKLQERKRMVERLTHLRQERLEEEEEKNRKRKKKAHKKGEKYLGDIHSMTIREEYETEEDPADFVSDLIDGYIDSFEGVEYYYPAVEDLSDCELLEETPVPASSGQTLTEEMNLADMIRDSYKVSVEMLSRGEKGDLRELFQKWISEARSKWKQLDSHPEYIKSVDEARRKKDGKEKDQFGEVAFSVPTDARNKTLEWFERDWGLKKAATQNFQLCEKYFGKRQPLKPVPVYLVNSELDDTKEEDPGLKKIFTSNRSKTVDVDIKNSDPFSRKTYYVSDAVYDFTRSRLMRHRDIIYDIFQFLKRRYLKKFDKRPKSEKKTDFTDSRHVFLDDKFLIFSQKLHNIFHAFPPASYISWSQASDFLFRNHLWNIPGPAIRPVDPLFYPDNAHKAYRHLPTLVEGRFRPLKREQPCQRPHQAATFIAVASTGEVWRRHSSKVYGFRDPHKWEMGLRRWAGPELLMSSERYMKHPAEKRQEFIDKFHEASEKEKSGEIKPWWLLARDGDYYWRLAIRDLPLRYSENEDDRLANLFQPTWYGEWRRPWQRNLGYSAEEMLGELQILRDIAEEQEEELVDTQDGWKRKRESSLLESDFYPSVCTKPVTIGGAEHFMNQHVSNIKSGDVPWDQTYFTNVAWRLYGKEPERPAKKRKTFSRTTWVHPKRQEALDSYRLQDLYGVSGALDSTNPKQVYLCWSEDDEDRLEQKREQERERKLGERYFKDSLPKVVEISDGEEGGSVEPIVEEVDESGGDGDSDSEESEPGYDFGPTIEEMEDDED